MPDDCRIVITVSVNEDKGSRDTYGNFRVIRLLSVLRKLYGKVLT